MTTSPEISPPGGEPRWGRPFWKSKTFLLAGVLALLGLAMWWRAPVVDVPPPEPTAGRASLRASPPSGGPAVVTKRPPLPALFRFGASYMGGFVVGWAWRRSLRTAAWVATGLLGGLALLQWTGLLGLDWGVVRGEVSEGFQWFQGQASELKTVLSGYLPSSTVGVVGMFLGARK